jgi:phospholipid transport system substrate-binding protein
MGIGPSGAQAQDISVVAPIQRLCDALISVMKEGRTVAFQQRFDHLAPTVDDVFDLGAVLETSVGPGWSQMSPDQHGALATAFRRYTIDSYVSSFDEFSGQHFEVSPTTRALPNGEQVVTTRIIPTSGDSHRLDYVMRQENGAWKAVDVLADGTISRVAVQRSDFRHMLMLGGGAALIASLQRKASDLETG